MNDLYPNIFKNLTRSPITIILLDNRKQTMVYDKTTKLRSLFEATCDLCYVDSDSLFGFAILLDDYYAFLDLDTKVYKLNFKELEKKSQSNVLFKPWVTHISPIHQKTDENRRHSQGMSLYRNNYPLQNSTSSTKSAPVSHSKVNSINNDDTPVLYFRIKSYVNIHCLRDRITKMLYFQQLMRNVLDYKLQCADEVYLQLGAYAIQAFYGDFNLLLTSNNDDGMSVSSSNTDSSNTCSPTLAKLRRSIDRYQNFTKDQILSGQYFEPRKFFPSWIITKYTPEYLYKEISQLHKSLAGLSRYEAEFNYIRMASAQYSNFNMHIFPVRDQTLSGGHSGSSNFPTLINSSKQNGIKNKKSRLWLGLSPAGLEMHEMKNSDTLVHMSTLKWNDIDEVTQKPYRINIHMGCRSLKLHTNTKMQADHLFWLTRHMHIYQTKARLNAPLTAEALELVERQKYREKYVYMDLDDLKQHGLQVVDRLDDFNETFVADDLILHPVSKFNMPIVNTPAVPPRRTPSKAKPKKMKDLMRMSNQTNESVNENRNSLPDTTKRPQYIKKTSTVNLSNNYTVAINKGMRSPEILRGQVDIPPNILNRNLKENYLERHSFQSDIDSDQNTSKAFEMMDESDLASSLNDSEGRSPGRFGLKQTGRFISLSQEFDNFEDFPSANSLEPTSQADLLPPKQFRGPIVSNTHISKSVSFDNYDTAVPKQSISSQRQLSEPQLSDANLHRSLPMIMGLCEEFNESKIINDIKSSKLSNVLQNNQCKSTVGMKSWKSDILFNLNNCVDVDEDEDSVLVGGNVSVESPKLESQCSRRNSEPKCPTQYRDATSSSSTLDSNDSVDISSLSSFDLDYVNYSKINRSNSVKNQISHITII